MSLNEYLGCGDTGCLIEKPKVGTNGGCRCLTEVPFHKRVRITKAIKRKHAEREEAIRIVEKSRQTHIDWLEWQESTPDWREYITSASPGEPDHHRDYITEYDKVLKVLKELG